MCCDQQQAVAPLKSYFTGDTGERVVAASRTSILQSTAELLLLLLLLLGISVCLVHARSSGGSSSSTIYLRQTATFLLLRLSGTGRGG